VDGSGNTDMVAAQTWMNATTSDNWATWSLDLSADNPYTNEYSYTVRARAIDNVGNNSAIAAFIFTYFTGEPRFTTLDLSLSSSSIEFNNSIDPVSSSTTASTSP